MKVSLFITCIADIFYPNVGKSVVEVLESLGVEVDFPAGQTCCGQPAYNSGYLKEAKDAAKHMIAVFEESEYIVCPSGSCASMVRHYYPTMFKDDPEWRERAEKMAQSVYEFSEFIVKILKVEKIESFFEGTATYHRSCHMSRGLKVVDEPVKLLKGVEGIEYRDLPYQQDCCGFGGTFAVKMPEIAGAMADEKIDHIKETGAQILCGSDMSCLMHIGGRARRRGEEFEIMHLAEVLAKGLKK